MKSDKSFKSFFRHNFPAFASGIALGAIGAALCFHNLGKLGGWGHGDRVELDRKWGELVSRFRAMDKFMDPTYIDQTFGVNERERAMFTPYDPTPTKRRIPPRDLYTDALEGRAYIPRVRPSRAKLNPETMMFEPVGDNELNQDAILWNEQMEYSRKAVAKFNQETQNDPTPTKRRIPPRDLYTDALEGRAYIPRIRPSRAKLNPETMMFEPVGDNELNQDAILWNARMEYSRKAVAKFKQETQMLRQIDSKP